MTLNKTSKKIEKEKKKQVNKEIWVSSTFLIKYAEQYRKNCFCLLIFQWCLVFLYIFLLVLDLLVLLLVIGVENIKWYDYIYSVVFPLAFLGINNTSFYIISRVFTLEKSALYFISAYFLGILTFNILPLIHCNYLYKKIKKIAIEQSNISNELTSAAP